MRHLSILKCFVALAAVAAQVVSAVLNVNEPIHCGKTVDGKVSNSEGIIYKFSLQKEDFVSFDTCGSEIGTVVAIWDASTSQQVAYTNDSTKCDGRAVLATKLSEGKFYVMVRGNRSSMGPYTMTMTCDVQSMLNEHPGDTLQIDTTQSS